MARKKDPNFPMQGKGGAMGGKYARKAENLTAKELKAAGAAKAARKRTVSISDTRRVTEGANKGRTLGPGGKPLTGSVRLENGSMAVYKNGKRVVKAAAPKPAAKSSASRSAARPATRPATKPNPKPNPKPDTKNKDKNKGAAKPAVKFGKTYTTKTQTNPQAGRRPTSASTGGQVPSSSRSYSNGAASSPSSSSSGNGKKWYQPGGGGLAGPNSPLKKGSSGIKVGEVRNIGPNSEPHRWDGSKFVPVSGSRAPKAKPPAGKPKTKVVYVNNQATVADLQPDGTYKPRPRK